MRLTGLVFRILRWPSVRVLVWIRLAPGVHCDSKPHRLLFPRARDPRPLRPELFGLAAVFGPACHIVLAIDLNANVFGSAWPRYSTLQRCVRRGGPAACCPSDLPKHVTQSGPRMKNSRQSIARPTTPLSETRGSFSSAFSGCPFPPPPTSSVSHCGFRSAGRLNPQGQPSDLCVPIRLSSGMPSSNLPKTPTTRALDVAVVEWGVLGVRSTDALG